MNTGRPLEGDPILVGQRPIAEDSPAAVKRAVDGQRRDTSRFGQPGRQPDVPLDSLVSTAAVAKEHDGHGRVTGRPPQHTGHVIVAAPQHETELTVGPAICVSLHNQQSSHLTITAGRRNPCQTDWRLVSEKARRLGRDWLTQLPAASNPSDSVAQGNGGREPHVVTPRVPVVLPIGGAAFCADSALGLGEDTGLYATHDLSDRRMPPPRRLREYLFPIVQRKT